MSGRVVITRVGDHLFSFPFLNVDEILSKDRIVKRSDLPEDELPSDIDSKIWVHSKGRWLPLGEILPDTMIIEGSQVVVLKRSDHTKAYLVDDVLELVNLDDPISIPEIACKFIEKKYKGVHIWKERLVLELDLSELV